MSNNPDCVQHYYDSNLFSVSDIFVTFDEHAALLYCIDHIRFHFNTLTGK